MWALCWAADNPALLATMEKTRMYVLRNEEPEEPIVSAGYVCCFRDLEVSISSRKVTTGRMISDPELSS